MKLNNKIVFVAALVVLILGGLSTFYQHQRVSLILISISFFLLSLATISYIWETRNED